MVIELRTKIKIRALTVLFLAAVRFASTKQETMRVEWYNEDFSDPEAVSGSSTNNMQNKPR